MIDAIDHINLVVRDLQRMTRFYCEVLGFTVSKEVTISGRWIDAVVGLSDVLAEVVYLDLTEGSRIELIRYLRPEGSGNPVAVANIPGIRHARFEWQISTWQSIGCGRPTLVCAATSPPCRRRRSRTGAECASGWCTSRTLREICSNCVSTSNGILVDDVNRLS